MLLALPMAFAFTSCDDDNDLPDVTMGITVSDAVQNGDMIYVVQGDTLKIDGIEVKNNEAGKNAAITSATYYWDGVPQGVSIISPYGFDLITVQTTDEVQGTPLGNHQLVINCPLLAEDKEVATAVLSYTVKVVQSADDIPDGGQTAIVSTPTLRQDK